MELGRDSLLNVSNNSGQSDFDPSNPFSCHDNALPPSNPFHNVSSEAEKSKNDIGDFADNDSLDLNFENLDLTCEDLLLDDLEDNIQANLEDNLVREALDSGVELSQYSKEVENQLFQLESGAIKDYISEASNICKLHKQISQCDNILARMEGMLEGFQSDLGSISSEIHSLQAQSISMNIKLKNRQSVRGELSQFVDEMTVPEALIVHINDTSVAERKFIEQLHELSLKINFVKEQSFKEAKSVKDVSEVIEKLKIKAITKIREFLMQKIISFKKPLSNYQIVQTAMLKVNFFYQFLLSHERMVAKEIRDEYVDTISKVYFSYFKTYIRRVLRLSYSEVPDKYDMIGYDDNIKKGFFSSKPVVNKHKSAIFSLGSRHKVLTEELEMPALVPHAAAQTPTPHYNYEVLFRSIMFALMDNCCREYLFLCDFFLVSGSGAQDLFMAVLAKTLDLVKKEMTLYVNDSFDGVGNFLCLHVIYRYQVIMHKRQVPALDRYWDALSKVIWTRFHYIVDKNIQSILECDVQKIGLLEIKPHYITRRSAEFSAAIVSINENFSDERVTQLLAQLQGVVDGFLNRIAKEFQLKRDQLIFVISNYDLVLSTISERSREDGKETEMISKIMNDKIQDFIEQVLITHFGGMINFVKSGEAFLQKNDEASLKREENKIVQLVKNFAQEWRHKIELINVDCTKPFQNFKVGTHILQGALTQLTQYYLRFQKILSQPPFKNHHIRGDLVNIHHVMVEVKKFKPTF